MTGTRKSRTKMTGGIIRRGSTWSYTIYTPNVDADGNRSGGKGSTRWVGGFASREEAGKAKRDAQLAQDRGVEVRRRSDTVREFIEQDWLAAVAAHVKPTTLVTYRQTISHALPFIGTKRLQAVGPQDIQRVITGMLADGRSPRTTGKTLTVLRIAFKHAVRLKLISSDPTAGARKPRVDPVHRDVMSMSDIAAVDVAARDTTWSAFVRLALYTGCRRGENLGIRWEDVDLESSAPHVRIRRNVVDAGGRRIEQSPKNGEGRVVSIDAGTVSVLRAHRARQNQQRLRLGKDWNALDYVTCLEDGTPPMPHSATQAWSRLCKAAGLSRWRLHDARHAHATTLLEAGEPLHVVAARLGHRDASVTATVYAHVTVRQHAGAADIFAASVAAAATI